MVIGNIARSQSMWAIPTRSRHGSDDLSYTGSTWSLSNTEYSSLPNSSVTINTLPPSATRRRLFKKRVGQTKRSSKLERRMTIGPCISGDVTAADSQGRTLLFYAARYGQTEPAQQLIEAGSDPNWADNNGYTPLHVTVEMGQLEVAETLLKNGGANVNVAAKDGETPLLVAVSRGQIDFVRLFYKYGADINLCDAEGNTPIYRAVERGWVDVAEFLLDKQCDVNIASSNEKTCFSVACKCPGIKTEHMARRLLKLGYDFTKDAELLKGEGCPISSKDEPRLYDKVMSRAGLLMKRHSLSLSISNSTRKIFRTFRSLSK